MSDDPATNLAAAHADLAAARAAGDDGRATLLDTLIGCGGFIYRLERQLYGVQFGDREHARHVAVVVPGIGDETNLRNAGLPAARNLFEAERVRMTFSAPTRSEAET